MRRKVVKNRSDISPLGVRRRRLLKIAFTLGCRKPLVARRALPAEASFDRFSAHADGERRGARSSRRAASEKRVSGATRLWLPSERRGSSAFAVGMRRETEKKKPPFQPRLQRQPPLYRPLQPERGSFFFDGLSGGERRGALDQLGKAERRSGLAVFCATSTDRPRGSRRFAFGTRRDKKKTARALGRRWRRR